ncbi:hypothetical protein SAMN05216388_10286 [Halorientalis persicus]|uniref:Uncharacterized protein n=1 Tax=Halorientalis persicus TaxID=1367881 RepID=A0A1H8UJ48_9EURY|nr:hypothetical protein SAMN05216388_10286 [Halorientalis persicus]
MFLYQCLITGILERSNEQPICNLVYLLRSLLTEFIHGFDTLRDSNWCWMKIRVGTGIQRLVDNTFKPSTHVCRRRFLYLCHSETLGSSHLFSFLASAFHRRVNGFVLKFSTLVLMEMKPYGLYLSAGVCYIDHNRFGVFWKTIDVESLGCLEWSVSDGIKHLVRILNLEVDSSDLVRRDVSYRLPDGGCSIFRYSSGITSGLTFTNCKCLYSR